MSDFLYRKVTQAFGSKRLITKYSSVIKEAQKELDDMYAEAEKLGIKAYEETSKTRLPFRLEWNNREGNQLLARFESEENMIMKILEIVLTENYPHGENNEKRT
jgi:hypothetical protein